ncbi:SNF2-related protein [Noviherbaspirillum galbum]|uniref:Helicase ATP-binding domain-containing protein n=1 Tax=Noviherbaspirillum galbum TaxID=2709383 RepID=A0A6B3SNK8_9BURK|nr:SNF2-related protein [Noviherbaspirillum galbum]NEX62460.1 hypothetical protein [Noviherbaspirillum galbum]
MSVATSGLYPHQVSGIEFLKQHGRAILADDMGLGKTRQAIVAINEASPRGMILVICPASLKLNWKREIRLVDPSAAVEVLGVNGHSEATPRWVVVNYDILAKNAGMLRSINWAGIIVDEAHFIKNSSQRTSQVLKLTGVTDGKPTQADGPRAVYLLTGTPMPNVSVS